MYSTYIRLHKLVVLLVFHYISKMKVTTFLSIILILIAVVTNAIDTISATKEIVDGERVNENNKGKSEQLLNLKDKKQEKLHKSSKGTQEKEKPEIPKKTSCEQEKDGSDSGVEDEFFSALEKKVQQFVELVFGQSSKNDSSTDDHDINIFQW